MTIPPNPRELALDAAKSAINRSGYWLPVDGQTVVVDAIAAVYESEAEQIRAELAEDAGIVQALRRQRDEAEAALGRVHRRAVGFQARIDAARTWARQHLSAEQQAGLLGVLRGDQPKEPRP